MIIRIQNKKILVLITGILLFVISCDSNRIFDTYKPLKHNSWSLSNPLQFTFQISDTTSTNNLYFNIRNNNDYLFSNLYVISHVIFPDGKKIVDTLQYEMADKNGQFLGSGISEIKHSRLLLKENIIFPNSGKYSINIWHAMRENGNLEGIKELKGITDLGFRIEKVN